MNRFFKTIILFIFVFFLTINLKVLAEENLRGFDSTNDLKIGPVLSVGMPISYGSNMSFLPEITLNFHGESFLNGTTGISLSWLSSTRSLQSLVAGKTLFSEVSPNGSATKLTKHLLQITFSSPVIFQLDSSRFEFGWHAGIFSQFVNMDTTMSGDTNSNIGVNLGLYIKTFYLYPFVPSVSGKIILGNLYDNGKTYQDRVLSASLRGGYFLKTGIDYYLTKRMIFNLSYNLMNPDFFTLNPAKANPVQTGQANTQPADDPMFSFLENVQTISGSFGFLF